MNRAKKEAMIREARKPKPPKDIEIESKNNRLRLILLICSITVAVIAIGIGIHEAVSTDPGWQTVEVESESFNCGGEFVLNYNLGASGSDPSDEEKAVKRLYTKAAEDAYTFFYKEGQLSRIKPGETVSVAPELYSALELIQSYGNRSIYLAPVYVEYDRIFVCENEDEARFYDPACEPEIAQYVQQVAEFAADPEMIDLELLENSQVTLKLSPAYAAFAQENAIETFLDLGWMRNAFIADFIAERLASAGYTHGFLASYDGYTRNLDASNTVYSQNLFDRLENTVNVPAAMNYRGPMAIVFWRNYPLSNKDGMHYYSFSDGRIATVYLDPMDAAEKSATDNLVSYCAGGSCAQIMLRTAPLYLAEELDTEALHALTADGIYSVWFEGAKLQKNDPDLTIRVNTENTEVTYTFP